MARTLDASAMLAYLKQEPGWEKVAALLASTQVRATPGLTLPLADAIGMALTRRHGCDFVTADRKELTPLIPLGFCSFYFIR